MADLSVSVSMLEAFRTWELDPESTVEELRGIVECKPEPSTDMLRGLAFHRAIEEADRSRSESSSPLSGLTQLRADGFIFKFADEYELPEVRYKEIRATKNYRGLIVRARCDGVFGRRIYDHKTTSYVDVEKYMSGYQWRYYLDIFDADHFTWFLWEMETSKDELGTYLVTSQHKLVQTRYPNLHQDCQELANRFHEIHDRWLYGSAQAKK